MNSTQTLLRKQYARIGDRLIVQSNRKALAVFNGRSGVVVAVFLAPRGSCVIRMDDLPGRPEVFVYQTEVAAPLDW
ncbi:MAG: hypothetical protein OHK0022_00110 [Roseiflexaceae bacterium]